MPYSSSRALLGSVLTLGAISACSSDNSAPSESTEQVSASEGSKSPVEVDTPASPLAHDDSVMSWPDWHGDLPPQDWVPAAMLSEAIDRHVDEALILEWLVSRPYENLVLWSALVAEIHNESATVYHIYMHPERMQEPPHWRLARWLINPLPGADIDASRYYKGEFAFPIDPALFADFRRDVHWPLIYNDAGTIIETGTRYPIRNTESSTASSTP